MSAVRPDPFEEGPVEIPIDGVLDLHSFPPRQVKDLVLDYLEACQARGIREVRVIHGKGIGALKRTVHVLLGRHPEVVSFHLENELFGGSGATIVRLKAADGCNPGSDTEPHGSPP